MILNNLKLNSSNQQILKIIMVVIFSLLVVTFFTYQPFFTSATVDLDNSWKLAVYQLFLHGFIAGKDAMFTWGPLGYLGFIPINGKNSHFLFALYFYLISSIIYSLALGIAIYCHSKHASPSKLLFRLGVLSLAAMFSYYDSCFLPPLLTLIILDYLFPKHKVYLIGCMILITTQLLIKPGFTITMSLALITYLLFIKKDFKAILLTSLGLPVLYITAWLFIYQTTQGAFDYLQYSALTILGNNTMALENARWFHHPSILLMLLAILSTLFLIAINIKNRHTEKVPALISIIMILPFFALLKYGLGRDDAPHLVLMTLYFIPPLLMIIAFTNNIKKILFNSILTIVIIFFFYKLTNWFLPPTLNTQRFSDLIHWKKYKQTMEQQQPVPTSIQVSPKIKQKIGNSTVDAYPYLLIYVFANNFKWQPRPFIQSYYAAYQPKFDKINAKFFQNKGPEYLIWTNNTPGKDGRNILNSEPLLNYQIINWYDYWQTDPNTQAYILKRRKTPVLTQPKLIKTSQINVTNWCKVPQTTEPFLFAKINLKQNIIPRILQLIYKQKTVQIQYKYLNGTIGYFKLITPHTKDGLWLKPIVSPLSPLYKSQNHKVVAFRIILSSKLPQYNPNTQIAWYTAHYKKS